MTLMRYSLLIVTLLMTYVLEEAFGLTASEVTVTDRRGDYVTALSHCKSLGLKLIRIQSENENNLVYGLAQRVGRYWIDGNDNQKEGFFVNSDNQVLTYTKWHRGQPDNFLWNENCIEVRFFGDETWNDINCNTNNGIVCYTEDVILKEVGRTVHVELMNLPDKVNYKNGLDLCKHENLEMVKIDSAEMNKLVHEFAAEKRVGEYWIDLNDIHSEGSWVSSDNTRAVYKNFAAHEPNGGRHENCVESYKDGSWNDISCNNAYSVICFKIIQK